MTDMPIYWIKNLDLDGYRCDAAGEIPTDFWDKLERNWIELSRTS
jgi:cyclomaltodextrinase